MMKRLNDTLTCPNTKNKRKRLIILITTNQKTNTKILKKLFERKTLSNTTTPIVTKNQQTKNKKHILRACSTNTLHPKRHNGEEKKGF